MCYNKGTKEREIIHSNVNYSKRNEVIIMKTVWALKKTQIFFDSIETRLVGLFSDEEQLIDYVDKQIDAQEYDWEEVEIDELVEKN